MRPRRPLLAVAAALLSAAMIGSVSSPAVAATTGSIEVELLNAEGKPDTSRTAGLWKAVDAPGGTAWQIVAVCTPNLVTQTCDFSSVAPGEYLLETDADGQQSGLARTYYRAGTRGTIDVAQASRLRVNAGGTTLARIQVQQGATVTGRFANWAGRVDQAMIDLIRENPLDRQTTPTVTQRIRPAADGSFTARGLGAGRYKVRVTQGQSNWLAEWVGGGTDFASAPWIEVGAAGRDLGAIKQDIGGQIRGAFSLSEVPSSGVWLVTAYRNVGAEGHEEWVPLDPNDGEQSYSISVRADGRTADYRYAGLPAGRYRLRFLSPGFTTQWNHNASSISAADDVHVLAGETVEVSADVIKGIPSTRSVSTTALTLPATGSSVDSLTAKVGVRSAAGDAIAGRVQIFENGRFLAESSTDEVAGDIALPPLSPGTHKLTAYFVGNRWVRSSYSDVGTVVVKAPATAKAKTASQFTVARGGKVTVTIVAAGSTPTGTVTIKYGSKKVGAAKLTAAAKGKATVTVRGVPRGTRTLSVAYAGSSTVTAATTKLKVTVR